MCTDRLTWTPGFSRSNSSGFREAAARRAAAWGSSAPTIPFCNAVCRREPINAPLFAACSCSIVHGINAVLPQDNSSLDVDQHRIARQQITVGHPIKRLAHHRFGDAEVAVRLAFLEVPHGDVVERDLRQMSPIGFPTRGSA